LIATIYDYGRKYMRHKGKQYAAHMEYSRQVVTIQTPAYAGVLILNIEISGVIGA